MDNQPRWAFIHPFQLSLQRGIEVYLWNLAVALTQEDIQVDILTWDGPLRIPDYAQVPGIQLRRVPAVRYFQANFALPFYIHWLIKNDYQQVFVHFAGYGEGAALRFARAIKPIPFSVVFHYPRSQVPHRYQEFKRWHFDRDAAHLIGVSQATANEAEAWSGRPCVVIEHGVDEQRFHPDSEMRNQMRLSQGLSEDDLVLISVAALEERKGVQWVIRALPELLQHRENIRYWVLGDGPYRGQLDDLTKQLRIEDKVTFWGTILDVEPYLAASDIAFLLSYGEASPVSLLEFISSDLPVITSKHPPFPELVKPKWGIMVDETNADDLVQAILELSRNPTLRRQMGKAGREWVQASHTWQRVAERYKALIAGEA